MAMMMTDFMKRILKRMLAAAVLFLFAIPKWTFDLICLFFLGLLWIKDWADKNFRETST